MKVLVVEDEKEILDFVKSSLRAENFIVDTAGDGEKGMDLAKSNNYDIMVLDNIMPKKTGLEICQEVRKKKINTPIIMISVKSESTTKVNLLNAGADDYITKPFSLDELLARMRALLRRPAVIENAILKLDDLELDINRHLVRRAGKDIHLTRKEFMLVKYMMKNMGSVLSRGMILEHVWDMNVDIFSNTIESHIRSIRRKIDTKGKKKLIHTISGRGYKMDLK